MQAAPIIRLSLLTGLLISPAFASPKRLTSYDQLLSAVQQGYNAKAIVHMDDCVIEKEDRSQSSDLAIDKAEADTRFNFTVYSHYKVKIDAEHSRYAIATSVSILTEHNRLGTVYAYERLRVFEDNSAELFMTYYDAKTFASNGAITLRCEISDGTDKKGVQLFRDA